MRNRQQIEKIKSYLSDPYSVENFISDSDISLLVEIYNSGNKTHKNTGPITLGIGPYMQTDVFKKILSSIRNEIGPFEVTTGLFFKTDYPHIIHNDDTFELPDTVYKAITIPLKIQGTGVPKLCFFDQFYFHGPSKFFNGSNSIPTYYNQQLYEYSNVDGLVNTPFVGPDYFTHLHPLWLEGLSFHSALDWIPGNALIFDSVRLHCASDFRSLGITSKLGLSIFTKAA